jgi:hypothetical protein
MTTKPPLQKILQGILCTDDKSKQSNERSVSYYRRRKEKESESNIDSTAESTT